MTQLVLPVDVDVDPTIAMQRGDSQLSQCAQCGLLACHESADRLGACPNCGTSRWWRQPFDTGPFARREDRRRG